MQAIAANGSMVSERLPPLPSPTPATHPIIPPTGKLMNSISQSANDGNQAGQLVSRILQVALGLFVTTMDLPSLTIEQSLNQQVGFDCDFSQPCRWSSLGSTSDRWRLAKGEPDALLWLAATGTMVLPSEPFTLIEVRGGTPGDMLTSDIIGCQRDFSLFSFTYWTIGQSDLEICLLDLQYRQFNCTGLLQSHIQPGQVALKIPPIKHPFHIAIIPSSTQGILIIDNIKYDAKYCGLPPPVILPLSVFPTETTPIRTTTTTTIFLPTFSPPFPQTQQTLLPTTTTKSEIWTVLPFTLPPPFTTTPAPVIAPILTTDYTFGIRVTEPSIIYPSSIRPLPIIGGGPFTTVKPIVIEPEPLSPIEYKTTTTTSTTMMIRNINGGLTTKTELPPFDLLIVGNLTVPLHDRRRGRLIDDTGDLLCDFANNFPCFWGPEAGKWAIIEKGAIPSLEDTITNHAQLPSYPAAVVIQGSAMFSSDPIRCQTGEGKLLFRYWTNGRVLMQVCAMGYNSDSNKIQCVEEVAQSNALDDTTLAVFELTNEIREPFTLNIVPIWEKDSRNNYMVIDEIAYIGECNLTILNEIGTSSINSNGGGGGSGGGGGGNSNEELTKTNEEIIKESEISKTTNTDLNIIYTSTTTPRLPKLTINKLTLATPPPIQSQSTFSSRPKTVYPSFSTPTFRPTLRPIDPTEWISKKPGTRYPFSLTTSTKTTKTPFRFRSTTTISNIPESATIYPATYSPPRKTTLKNSFIIPFTITKKYILTTEEPPLDYCKLLNCDFNDNACNYLNHGLTKIPWTLRTKGYGFPLARHTDLRPTPSNGQFISTVLGAGDYAILESPRFNLTQGINVLLFQYFRPTHSSTIRLCMGTRYSKPLRTVSSFLQCPPILRSLTSKNAFKWNSVHIQLPPGTSHFYLIAHNLDRTSEKSAIAIDNIRVAICDPRSFDPSFISSSSHSITDNDGDDESPPVYQEEEQSQTNN